MASLPKTEYHPEFLSHPGEILKELLDEHGMTQVELARRTDRPVKTINEIIKGKNAITTDTAMQLERVFGVPAHFWVNLENNYQEHLARKEERKRLAQQVEWLKQLPLREMIKRGWIEKRETEIDQVSELLNYFGVTSMKTWEGVLKGLQAAYRRSAAFEVDENALATWLRQGELEAMDIECADYDRDSFLASLREIRKLTTQPPEIFQEELRNLCALAGVAVVFIPQLPNTRVFGVTRWISPTKALIQLSLRYKTDDHLWFTFFHESAHILKHGKRSVFLDGEIKEGEMEEEANRFAASFLIPDRQYREFVSLNELKCSSVRQFAESLEIAPGIVVGRLQHDGYLPYNKCNSLKRHLEWV